MLFKVLSFLLLFMIVLNANKLDDIKKSEVIRIGVKYDFKPFGFINNEGKLDGFDIDLARFIADKLNVSAKFYQVSSKSRIPMLKNDTVDIVIASMTHTVKRDKVVDFSISYFFDHQAILVRGSTKEKEFKNFENKKVGVIKGSTSADRFSKLYPKSKLIYFSEYPQALRALKNGHVLAVSSDYSWCYTQQMDSFGTLRVLKNNLSSECYAVALKENESKLRDAVNFALIELVQEGVYSEIYEKWFGHSPLSTPQIW